MANVRDFGARGDGVYDDTWACRAAVAHVSAAGGGVVYFPAGNYLTDTLYVNSSNITIHGDGMGVSKIRRKSGLGIDCRVIAVNSKHKTDTATAYHRRVTIRDLSIDGNNTNVSSDIGSATVQGALMAGLIQDLTVRNVEVIAPREMGVNLLGCIGADLENVIVDGMLGENVVNSFNIFGGTVQDGPGGTITDTWPSRGIRIRSCRVLRNWVQDGDIPGNANGGIAICIQSSSDVIVSSCFIDITGETPFRGRNTKGIVFEGGGNPGQLMLGRSYVAEGNTVRGCKVGIDFVDSNGGTDTSGILEGVAASGNKITDCGDGILVHGRDASITGNSVSADTPLRLAIAKNSIEGDFVISGNTLIPKSGNGIHLSKSTLAPFRVIGVTISGNLIDGSSATGVGIYSVGAVHSFIISGNTIRDTAEAGIYFANGGGAENPRATDGLVTGNSLVNVCRAETIGYPRAYGIASAGVVNVAVGENLITGGTAMLAPTGSVNDGTLTIL